MTENKMSILETTKSTLKALLYFRAEYPDKETVVQVKIGNETKVGLLHSDSGITVIWDAIDTDTQTIVIKLPAIPRNVWDGVLYV